MSSPRAPGSIRKQQGRGEAYVLRRPSKEGQKRWRLLDRATRTIAKTYKGEPVDDGGYDTEREAERELARHNRAPMAVWVNFHPPKKCEFVMCKAPRVLECIGQHQTGYYCPQHAETRGFRIPERPAAPDAKPR